MLTEREFARMLDAAKAAAARAYCPYSKFRVGAAVLSGPDAIFAGCNVENASYGLTMCAERNAVYQMVAAVASPAIRAVLIYTPTRTPTAPCGACRQVLNEFCPGCEVISVCEGADPIRTTLDLLLPSAFGPRNLA